MTRRPLAAIVLLAATAVGCGDRTEAPREEAAPPASAPAVAVADGPAPVQLIGHTFLARPEDEGWVEEIDRAVAGPQFLLYLEPAVRSPAEGPWTLTLARDGDPRVLRLHNLRVERATARITFLIQSATMEPGEYLAVLSLEEGGMASGPGEQGFRFRIR